MVYPPHERYTPERTPPREPYKSRNWEEEIHSGPHHEGYEIGLIKSESQLVTIHTRQLPSKHSPVEGESPDLQQSLHHWHIYYFVYSYQNGPDTYLLQLRDVDFPVRLRKYMKVAANRGPGFSRVVSDQSHLDWRVGRMKWHRGGNKEGCDATNTKRISRSQSCLSFGLYQAINM